MLNKLDDLSMETSLFSEGKINVQGSLSFQEHSLIDLSISATKLSLGSLYSFLSQGQPIEEYALDFGGDAEAMVRMRMENGGLSLDGQFWIKDGSVKNEDKNLLSISESINSRLRLLTWRLSSLIYTLEKTGSCLSL